MLNQLPWSTFLMLALALLAVSCTSARRQTPIALVSAPVWPLPPAPPRIEYLRSLRGPTDIGQKPSMFKRLSRWITGDDLESLALQKPFGLALDESGNLCITDTSANRVYYCDFARKQWRYYPAAGKVRFVSPVAVARQKGTFYVADSELGKVFAFREDGKLVWEQGAPLRRPVGLAIVDGVLAVVDSQAHAIFLFDLQGRPRCSFGERGGAPGQFNFPTHIAADRQGHLLVTDSMNCRVQVFDLNGNLITLFGSNGDTSGHFGRPKGLAVDTFGHIYVADAVFDNFQIFDPAGQFLLNVGRTGSGPGEFGLPAGVAIGSDNQIYVADGYNHRVQVFKYIGER